ncbi:hypothetical protein FRC17_003069 [Serendipita sp. 399]|nr:hypothetical protein FRC17_003069 [Serendipita sp. 399]
MAPRTVVLRENLSPDEDGWVFDGITLPEAYVNRSGIYYGLHLTFTPEKIILSLDQFSSNRILQADDQRLFIAASFAGLRFKDVSSRVNIEYIKRFLKAGLVLNRKHYWFYGHSNSQLRSRSCFLRQGASEEDIHARIMSLGDFGSIKSAAKLAKRIGLLFSSATLDWTLDPVHIRDIPDIEVDDTLFSDGCGLISRYLASLIARQKQVIFRQQRYTPAVFQIRYKGYKGVLALHPELDKKKDGQILFRKSMRKFKGVSDNTFSVVEHSAPYVYARLNNDIVTLLSALGVPNEILLQKLRSYLRWLFSVRASLDNALDFLSSVGEHDLAERVILEGLEDRKVQVEVTKALKKEFASFKKLENDKDKLRLLVHKSRFLFGVCDPYQVLEEGEVFVRVTMPRLGPQTIHSVPVMVVRNPCMHPGDCLKLRAVDKPELRHLVDCIVFASKGKHAAPSLSSGGDLDGDKFTVIWDKELVPPKIAEHFLYPAVPEKKKEKITRQDLAAHFAAYNSISMGRAASLHARWVRCRPDGAMSSECQQLNALYSKCVDGAIINIPEHLRTPPEPKEPFIVDIMRDEAKLFAQNWMANEENAEIVASVDSDAQTIRSLLTSDRISMTEFQVLQMVARIAQRSAIDIRTFFALMDFSALTAMQKRIVSDTFGMGYEENLTLWNSLMRSDLLNQSAFQRDLREPPLRLQRLYTTTNQGLSGFFEYLKRSLEHYKRRLIIIKTDDRFSAGIFIRGDIRWDEEHPVNDDIAVFAVTPTAGDSMSHYKATVSGYRLHCSDGVFQLYNNHIRDTWVFINRPPKESRFELQASIALQKISARTQKQVGRIQKTPIIGVEIHVVSNQDRVAQQIFDLRLERVPTEERLRSVAKAQPYVRNTLATVNWEKEPEGYKDFFLFSQSRTEEMLNEKTPDELDELLDFALIHHEETRAFWIFKALYTRHDTPPRIVAEWLLRYPDLVYSLLHSLLIDDIRQIPSPLESIRQPILDAVVLTANDAPAACIFALQKLRADISLLTFSQYADLLWTAANVIRTHDVVQDVLIQLDEQRGTSKGGEAIRYAHRQALQIAFERAEEAFEECPCDTQGRPTKQRTAPARVWIHAKKEKEAAEVETKDEGDKQPVHEMQTRERYESTLKHPLVVADVRVDKPFSARLHSHVRLAPASRPEKQTASWRREILDGIVTVSFRGHVEISLFHHPPSEYHSMEWSLYDCGSTATAKAKLEAIKRLYSEVYEACAFHEIITGSPVSSDAFAASTVTTQWEGFNPSQCDAINNSCGAGLSLIWGPPGTGKTTVIVKILELVLKKLDEGEQILMAASTHNAVDNVLERFAYQNSLHNWVPETSLIRAATDHSRVAEGVRKYTVDALLGGSPNDDPKLIRQAEKRIKEAKIVFSTCAGSGLGTLRKLNFSTVIIDEASQVTEAEALIPIVKGCRRATMVGDHVQLRPTLKNVPTAMRSAFGRKIEESLSNSGDADVSHLLEKAEWQQDASLFERLYVGPDTQALTKSMLDTQYRCSAELTRFPSIRFYEGRLKTGTDTSRLQQQLSSNSFPWHRNQSGAFIPHAFVQCSSPETPGRSVVNEGQAKVVAHIVELLLTPRLSYGNDNGILTIAVLTPYSRQVTYLKRLITSGVTVSTIDGFQGREADFVVFSTVRSNLSKHIGFLVDERRLNVAWTRARIARIIVGDESTLTHGRASVQRDTTSGGVVRDVVNELWKTAIDDCPKVTITLPDADVVGTK